MASGSDTAPYEVDAALSGSFYYRDGLLATPPSLESQYAQIRYARLWRQAGRGRQTEYSIAPGPRTPVLVVAPEGRPDRDVEAHSAARLRAREWAHPWAVCRR